MQGQTRRKSNVEGLIAGYKNRSKGERLCSLDLDSAALGELPWGWMFSL